MSSQLTVVKELADDHWYVTAEITPGGILPVDIFLYTNTGDVTLGNYSGVVAFDNLTRTQVWDGVTSFPTFGNKYLRYSQAKINVDFESDVDTIIANLVASVKVLSTAYQAAASTTTIYTIN